MTLVVTQPDISRPPLHLVTGGLPVVASPAEGAVTGIIQRSTDGIRWVTVRGAVDMEIDISGDVASVDDYEFRPGVLNRYRAGVMQEVVDTFGRTESHEWGGPTDTGHEWSTFGTAMGVVLQGVAGAYASTPDHATLDITGDLDLRIDLTIDDWSPAAAGVLIAKWVEGTNNRSFLFYLATDGKLTLVWSADGSAVVDSLASTVAVTPTVSGRLAVRVAFDVDNGAAGRTATFYTAPTLSGTWTQLGTPVTTATATSIFSGAAGVEVGTHSGGTSSPLAGSVHAVEVRSGIGGTAVANPDFSAQIIGTTSFADAAGRTWTINGSAYVAPEGDALDVAGGVGTILFSQAGQGHYVGIASAEPIGDCRVGASLATNAASGITGGEFRYGLQARWVDLDNVYQLLAVHAADDTISLRAVIRFAGVGYDLTGVVATPLVYTGSETYRIEGEWKGDRFRGRIWDPAAEPRPDWQVDVAVPLALRITGGDVGIAGYRTPTNSDASLTLSVNDFTVETGSPTFLAALTDDITPTLDGFWLTSTMRSFLNCAPMVVGYEEPERADRGGSQYVAGRTLPVAQVELMTGRTWTLTLRVPTLASARRLEYVIASGDVFYLLAPANCPIASGYYRVGPLGTRRVIPQGAVRLFNLPLTECAAPGPDVATAQSTWDTVLALYGTWDDVVAAVPTWEDLLDLVGDPSEVIVE